MQDQTQDQTQTQTQAQDRPQDRGSRITSPVMNIPAADIVDGGASAALPAQVDPNEVAILAQAEDPGTSHLRLQELATDHPLARPAVAANPAAGPELLAWLAALDDAGVNEALARRGR